MYIGQYPKNNEHFSDFNKHSIKGVICITSDDAQNMQGDEFIPSEDVQELMILDSEEKQFSKLVWSSLPSDQNIKFAVRLNIAATEIKNMILMDDFTVCVLYNAGTRKLAAMVVVAYLCKYCNFIPEQALELLQKSDPEIDINLALISECLLGKE